MYFTNLTLRNWRNFSSAELRLQERTFLVGPNASGKSNILDVFRFLRDISPPEGSLQKAISDRGGVSKLRSLSARRPPYIEIDVSLSDSFDREPSWRYHIAITQEVRGHRNAVLHFEKVWHNGELVLDRPDDADQTDPIRLTQTHLEQINTNAEFRPVAEAFAETQYLHLVPQLLKFPGLFSTLSESRDRHRMDPFGFNFLEAVARTPEKTRKSRLKKIEKALKYAVPFLTELREQRDETGHPHLEARYDHWRPHAGWQREDQFSDGTLRLIGLLWSLLDGDSLLLIEEPELSLNHSIIRQLPQIISNANRSKRTRRQVLISTHSSEILSSKQIGLEEIMMLTPVGEGTQADQASNKTEVRRLLEGGMTPGEAVLPFTEPREVRGLSRSEL